MSARANSTSTTAPMHWTMVPCFMFASSDYVNSNRGRAADDLRQFLGDRRLPRLVVDELQLFDDLTGIVGGGLHRDHPRRLLRRRVLVDPLEHQPFDITA